MGNKTLESKANSKRLLIVAEARMLFLKDSIEWLKDFIDDRKENAEIGTGKHALKVEEKAIEIATLNLEKFQKEYVKLEAEYGKLPYTRQLYS